MEKFAKDNCYFASSKTLPGAPRISEAAAAAKAEVPFAIAMLAQSATVAKNATLHASADDFLLRARFSQFWADAQWMNDSYVGVSDKGSGNANRNSLLAKHAVQALQRLADFSVHKGH